MASATPNGLSGPSTQPDPDPQPQPAAAPSPPQVPALPTPQANSLPSSMGPKPRDMRTLELLLTAHGVHSYESRIPQMLLDFAYRHTSSVLTDALHLAADPHTSAAGSKPSATAVSGVVPVAAGEAPVSANAVRLAVQARLGFSFGRSANKQWMQELARERNKVALPRVAPNEWGLRLPSERFVMTGVGWGLRDVLAVRDGESEEESEGEEMEGLSGGAGEEVEMEDIGSDGVEEGTMDDVFGDDVDVAMDE